MQHGHPDARAEIEGFAFAHTAARADQAFGLGAENAFRSCPRVGRGLRQHQGQGREQQKFHSAARSPRTQQARLEHARIVGHDQRVFRQQGGQIAEARMAQIEIAVRGMTSSRDAPRSSGGNWAICSTGNSK